MPSRILAAFVLLLALAFGATAVRADYVTNLNPRGDNFLALRTGPGTGYSMIRRMGPDTFVTVLGRSGDWLRVELEDGTRGWAFGDYIAPGFPPGHWPYEDEAGDVPLDDWPYEDEAGDVPMGDWPYEDEAGDVPIDDWPYEDEAGDVPMGGYEDEAGDVQDFSGDVSQWTRYSNDRFGTSIDYPAGLFRALAPPANNDGRTFTARQGEGGFIVFGSNLVFGMTIAELLADDEASGGYDAVTYRRSGPDWYVLSGYRAGEVFYRKVMLGLRGEVIHTFEITYPPARKPVFDPVAARMAQSMRGG